VVSCAPVASALPGVLVVDDDALVRAMLQAVLQRQGFAVWLADCGRAALEMYQRHREHIAVVLLDVRMPGLDGPQTLALLRRADPEVVCCFMTGHAGPYTPQDLLALGALHLFDKPFRMDELGQKLRLAAGRVSRRA
jgi:DNA-binding NtrC family response regulator